MEKSGFRDVLSKLNEDFGESDYEREIIHTGFDDPFPSVIWHKDHIQIHISVNVTQNIATLTVIDKSVGKSSCSDLIFEDSSDIRDEILRIIVNL